MSNNKQKPGSTGGKKTQASVDKNTARLTDTTKKK
jgi:hypothetical protein